MAILVNTPLKEEITKTLKAGDSILLSGVIYSAEMQLMED